MELLFILEYKFRCYVILHNFNEINSIIVDCVSENSLKILKIESILTGVMFDAEDIWTGT